MLWLAGSGLLWAAPPLACDSCRFEVRQLPFDLKGSWLFTREDSPANALPSTSTESWTLVRAPGNWKKAYSDGQLSRVGWYRGHFEFAPALQGQEVLFLINAYLAPLEVYLDGQKIYERQGRETGKRYFAVQPIPIRFQVTQARHVLTFRVDSILMSGPYQLPFQLRAYQPYDWGLAMGHFWEGDFRVMVVSVMFMLGVFFFITYIKTQYTLYLTASLAGMTALPFGLFPSDAMTALFQPQTLTVLHYIGIGSYVFHNLFAQYFYQFYRRWNWFSLLFTLSFCLGFVYLSVNFHLAAFQTLRLMALGYILLLSVHTFYILVRAWLQQRQGALTMLIGEGIWSLIAIHDVLLALGRIDSVTLAFVGVICATFSIMWVANTMYAQTFVENKYLVKDLKKKNERILRQLHNLQELNLAGERLAGLMDRYQVLAAVFNTLRDQIQVRRSSLYFVSQGHLVLFRTFPDLEMPLGEKVLELGETAIGVCAQGRQRIYLPDTNSSAEFPMTESQGAHSLLCLPLLDGKEILGVLSLSGEVGQLGEDSEERAIAETVTRFLTITLKNIQLMDETKKSARMEAELQTAAAVQHALFPKSLPQVANLEMASFFQSASETGGDWYGVTSEIDNTLLLMIGDVTGHGTPAALVTATASATCRTMAALHQLDPLLASPARFLVYLNRMIFETGAPHFLMTFFLARIELDTGLMTFANAGHNFPLLRKPDGTLKPLLNTNMRLGQSPEGEFREDTIMLEAGDLLFLYTDGLIENTNKTGDMYGLHRLKRFLKRHGEDSAKELVGHLISSAYEFYEDHPPEDDMTILTCKVVQKFPGKRPTIAPVNHGQSTIVETPQQAELRKKIVQAILDRTPPKA